jgi:hypothetical protein
LLNIIVSGKIGKSSNSDASVPPSSLSQNDDGLAGLLIDEVAGVVIKRETKIKDACDFYSVCSEWADALSCQVEELTTKDKAMPSVTTDNESMTLSVERRPGDDHHHDPEEMLD